MRRQRSRGIFGRVGATAGALVAAPVTVLALLVPVGLPAAGAATPAPDVASAVPASFTPKVNDGIVFALGQVGSTMVIGGSFTNVSPAGSSTVINRSGVVAFDAATGAIKPGFAPTIKGGTVFTILPGPAANQVYVGGSFTSVDGVATRLALLNSTTGAIVSGWNAPSVNKSVYTLQRVGGRLFVGGAFTTVGGTTHDGLVALNATSGALTDYVALNFTGHHGYGSKCNPTTQTCSDGTPQVHKITINPAATKLVAIGNFINVGTVSRDQVAEVTLGKDSASLDMSWKTDAFTAPCLVSAYDMDVRDVAFAPDGSYFVVVATGAAAGTSADRNVDGTNAPCDGAVRYNTGDSGQDVQPVWTELTGNDSFLSVAVTAHAVYVGGHQRWLNNALASDAPGPGSVPRPGIAALDPANGMPLAWNPGRNPRGAGCYVILATAQGIWIGSDTDEIGNYKYFRPKVAFFPYVGGYVAPYTGTPPLPGRAYSVGATADGASDPGRLSYRETNGSAFGTEQPVSSPIDWSQVDGAFYVDGQVVYGLSDGNLYERSFDGTTFGAQVELDPYDDPNWADVKTGSDPGQSQTYRGLRSNFAAEIPTVTSMTFGNGRLFYTLAGQSAMHWRWFEPDDGIVGAVEYTVAGTTNFSAVSGGFLAGGRFYWGDSATGELDSVAWSEGTHPAGSPKVSDPSTDWASRGLFLLPNSAAPVPTPDASFTFDCTAGPTCTFSATPWVDPDGGITRYAWKFGDGTTSAASTSPTATHRYASNSDYTAVLTVTSTGGGSASDSQLVDVDAALASIRYLGASHHAGVGRTFTVPLPHKLAKTDQLVLVESAASTKPGLTVPAGWSLAGRKSGKGMSSVVLTRRLGAGLAAGKVTLRFEKRVATSVLVSAYRGVSTRAIEHLVGTVRSGTKVHEAPTVHDARPGSWVVWAWSQRTHRPTSWSPPPGRSIRTRTRSTNQETVSGLLTDSGAAVQGTIRGGTARSTRASLGEIDWSISLSPALVG